MFEKLQIFQVSQAMAVHAGTRQAVLAQNIANADTPGYQARDIAPFSTLVGTSSGDFQLRSSRSAHLHGQASAASLEVHESRGSSTSPNGNAVSLEEEMMKAVDTKRQHDRALAIYKSSLTVLRSSLGRG